MSEIEQACDVIHLTVDFKKPSQFVGRSVESGHPVCAPLDNLEELFAWQPDDPKDCGQPFSIAYLPHIPKVKEDDATRTLLCHDMKGGYLIDRFPQGVEGKHATGYHFIYWNMVDVFVYFSHHFITIPPVGWINAAHRNGVTILGTFITESLEGYQRCRSILSTESLWKSTADRLVEIASYYGFDGWLLNIENEIDFERIGMLVQFVKYLTTRMHEVDAHSLVIWYDSVTQDGSLAWQNELNDNNSVFYDGCDGIFLNYSWKENNLLTSKCNSQHHNRVYVGIDVFGRGCYGGGGFNTSTALSVIRRYCLSAAIFAPGWVYEKNGSDNFIRNQERFWESLEDLCVSSSLNIPRGLTTNFNPGYGNSSQDSSKTWYNLSSQEVMPCYQSGRLSLKSSTSSGTGHCIRIRGSVASRSSSVMQFVTVFKVKMFAKSGRATISLDRHASRVNIWVKTDLGMCRLNGQRNELHNNEFQLENVSLPNLWSIAHDKPFHIESLLVNSTRSSPDIQLLQIIPDSPKPISCATTAIECKDVDWTRDETTERVFKFGGTLVFHNIPSERSVSKIYFCDNKASNVIANVLGSSYASCYRVHDLNVCNPQYDGPGCYIMFTVHHLSTIGEKLGEGRLKIMYAENV